MHRIYKQKNKIERILKKILTFTFYGASLAVNKE